MDIASPRLSDHFALANLPWFEIRRGRISLTSSLGHEILDIHTHLALSFLRRDTVDLWKEHPRTRHYLALERPIDLEVYANKNLTEQDVKAMKSDLTMAGATSGGMRKTHTAANLLREMDDLGIGRAIVLPIDFPALSYNAETFLEATRRTDRLVCFGSVHPYAADPRGKAERQKALGARGMKVHPASQVVAPDNDRAMELYEICADLDLPVLWHCGPVGIEPKLGRMMSQVKHYWRPVAECKRTTFILGHSGALQLELALELARGHENTYLDVSCQGLEGIRRIMAKAPPERIVFGSDWPFYHQGFALAKLLIATQDDEDARHRILFENAARLLDIA